jgi:hypothetical protein
MLPLKLPRFATDPKWVGYSGYISGLVPAAFLAAALFNAGFTLLDLTSFGCVVGWSHR